MGSNLRCISRENYSTYKGSETRGCYRAKRTKQEKFTTTRSEIVDNWMDLYFEKIVDHMPDKNSMHLPTWMTQAWLHEEFLKNMKTLQGGTFSRAPFASIWSL